MRADTVLIDIGRLWPIGWNFGGYVERASRRALRQRFNNFPCQCIAVYHFDAMELGEAISKADQILNEERKRPTVSYGAPNDDVGAAVVALTRAHYLNAERTHRPRHVHESPYEFRFESINHELLLALYAQVQADDRAGFVAFLLGRISEPVSAQVVDIGLARFPSGNNYISDLPLLAEFCIRVGYKRELIRAIGESLFTRGLVLLLMQMEDTIALNFNLFSDEELDQLATTLKDVRARAHRKTYQSSRPRRGGERRVPNPDYDPRIAPVATQTVTVCDGVVEECKQARYWYLKGALQVNSSFVFALGHARDGSEVFEHYHIALAGSLRVGEIATVGRPSRQSTHATTPFTRKYSARHAAFSLQLPLFQIEPQFASLPVAEELDPRGELTN